MRTQIHLYRRCAAALIGAAAMMAPATGAHAAFQSQKVLFIGNSYTYNAMGYDGSTSGDGTSSDRFFSDSNTSVFEALVIASSNSSNELFASGSQNIAVGGRKLSQHTGVDSTSTATILHTNNFGLLDQDWDVIVIQEYSTVPGRTVAGAGNPFKQADYDDFYTQGLGVIASEMNEAGRSFLDDTQVILFSSWARAPGSSFYNFTTGSSGVGSNYPNGASTNSELFSSYEQMRDLTAQGYEDAAAYLDTNLPNPIDIAEIGAAFDFALSDPGYNPALFGGIAIKDVLYEDDDSHQAPGGEFLSAAVLFEMIYGQSVLSLIDQGILTQADLNDLAGGNDDFPGPYDLDIDLARYLATVSQDITGVPEPASLVLLGAASLLLAARRRR